MAFKSMCLRGRQRPSSLLSPFSRERERGMAKPTDIDIILTGDPVEAMEAAKRLITH
jgi:hypothetical protein